MSHTQSWWDYRHLDNVLLLHYTDMLADPAAAVQRIARFLAFEISDEALVHVVQHTSFDAMHQRAIVWEAEGRQRYPGGARTFFHRGMNGRWRDVLTAAELDMYEQKKAAVLDPECAQWLEHGRAAMQA